MIKRAVLLYLGLACVIPLQGHGANPIDTQEQLDSARANQEAREARLGEERIQWQHISSNTDGKTPRPASGSMSVSPSFYRLYNKCWGGTTTVSLPTLFFCKKNKHIRLTCFTIKVSKS